VANALKKAALVLKTRLQKNNQPVALTLIKDFPTADADPIWNQTFSESYTFSTQPNMVLQLRSHWEKFEEYVADFNKKYRDQYKRARKKHQQITAKELSLEEIRSSETAIHALYLQVVSNASFNTFYLKQNHFTEMKAALGDKFLVTGYYLNQELVSFCTLIQNNQAVDTYFLGYNAELQKEYQLYLNMLYDMIGYGIQGKFKGIVFSRTALEIKSSVGAEPIAMHGYIRHRNPLIQMMMPWLFRYLDPVPVWQQRHPFKD
jgi:predicted N-acyltransferase